MFYRRVFMKITDIVARINNLCGNGRHTYKSLEGYLDECIDDINEALYTSLPLVSDIYRGISPDEMTQTEIDNQIIFATENTNNEYTRIPDAYIRNYVCYEVAYRKLRDEDEDQEVYGTKYSHANRWFKKLVAEFSDFHLSDVEAVVVNGDYDELVSAREGINPKDDTRMGFYNPTTSSLWKDES